MAAREEDLKHLKGLFRPEELGYRIDTETLNSLGGYYKRVADVLIEDGIWIVSDCKERNRLIKYPAIKVS